CQRKGLAIAKEYEIDESSTIDDRRKFFQIIDSIKASKSKIALVVETVDRLQRSFKESVMLDELRKQGQVELHFVREALIVSGASSSSDIMRWNFHVMIAQSYVLQLSDNVKRSIKEKLRRGECISKHPFGYKIIRLDSGKTDLTPDPHDA